MSNMSIDELFKQLDELAQAKRADITHAEDIINIYINEEIRSHVENKK